MKASAVDPYEGSTPQQKLLSELNQIESLINDKAELDIKWREILTMSEIFEVIWFLHIFPSNCYNVIFADDQIRRVCII